MSGTIGIGGAVDNPIRVTLEIETKAKKVVAVVPDLPGLERGTKPDIVMTEVTSNEF